VRKNRNGFRFLKKRGPLPLPRRTPSVPSGTAGPDPAGERAPKKLRDIKPCEDTIFPCQSGASRNEEQIRSKIMEAAINC